MDACVVNKGFMEKKWMDNRCRFEEWIDRNPKWMQPDNILCIHVLHVLHVHMLHVHVHVHVHVVHVVLVLTMALGMGSMTRQQSLLSSP